MRKCHKQRKAIKKQNNLVKALRMDFSIVVLSVHDDDEVCRDVDAPAE